MADPIPWLNQRIRYFIISTNMPLYRICVINNANNIFSFERPHPSPKKSLSPRLGNRWHTNSSSFSDPPLHKIPALPEVYRFCRTFPLFSADGFRCRTMSICPCVRAPHSPRSSHSYVRSHRISLTSS